MLEGMYECVSARALGAAGWDSHQIKAAEGCCLRRLERGWYLVSGVCDHSEHSFVSDIASASTTTLPVETKGLRKRVEDMRILVRCHAHRLPPEAVFSHRSALLVHGLPIPFLEEDEVFAECISPRCGVRLANMYVRRRRLGTEGTEIVRGMPTTTVLQTLLDIARDCPLAFSVAVLDTALRKSVVGLEEFEAYCNAHPVRTGGRRIASVIANVDSRRETVAESICAVRFVEHSIAGFEPQVSLCDDRGRFLARPDFVNESAKVVAEFDGAGKYYLEDADPNQAFEHERQREYAIRNEGWMVFRIRWSDLFRPDVFLRIKEAVRRREVSKTAYLRKV